MRMLEKYSSIARSTAELRSRSEDFRNEIPKFHEDPLGSVLKLEFHKEIRTPEI